MALDPRFRVSFKLKDGRVFSDEYWTEDAMARMAGYWQDERAMARVSEVRLEELEEGE